MIERFVVGWRIGLVCWWCYRWMLLCWCGWFFCFVCFSWYLFWAGCCWFFVCWYCWCLVDGLWRWDGWLLVVVWLGRIDGWCCFLWKILFFCILCILFWLVWYLCGYVDIFVFVMDVMEYVVGDGYSKVVGVNWREIVLLLCWDILVKEFVRYFG